ncbi:Jag family protein [Granulicella arctica]|uniref:Jag family protein n=1 Tax=Granulicella arctica TaxID=940613 RepID=UPI0021E0A424|nr:R3H domain-containing nucleic acid-binding protein [Granulicella arctica]
MTPQALAVEPLEDLLRLITVSGSLDLRFEIASHPGSTPEMTVELSGPDTALLTDRNGELLHAIEHIAAKILRLEPEEHDRLSFDADRFKADRDDQLRLSAEAAIVRVRQTGEPFAFNAMTSRERRMLHLVLKESGLPTASSGEGPRRFVVLYPEGHEPAPQAPAVTPDRTHQIRNSFRRR